MKISFKNLNKNRSYLYILVIFVVTFSTAAYAYTNSPSYKAPGKQNCADASCSHSENVVRVQEYSECKDVTNSRGKDVFIPTKTQNEWNLFKAAAHNINVAISDCATAPTQIDPTYDQSYCGRWDGANTHATTLWKTDGSIRTYIGNSQNSGGDAISCVALWDAQAGNWIGGKICKYGDERECGTKTILTPQAASYNGKDSRLNPYPACAQNYAPNGNGCKASPPQSCPASGVSSGGYCAYPVNNTPVYVAPDDDGNYNGDGNACGAGTGRLCN